MKKILIIAAVLLAIVAAVMYFSNTNLLNEWRAEREYNARKAAQDEYLTGRQAELDALVDLYKADTYGGATPQETWSMFITALEAGDTDLAAMYFVPEKQEEEKAAWAVAKEKGFIDDFLLITKRAEGGSYYKNDRTRYQFVVIGTEGKWDGIVEFTYDLKLNKLANIWKISDL